MATSFIDRFSFSFWRSDPPKTVHYQSESFVRTGVDGVGKVRTGKRGSQFQTVVEEDCESFAFAMGLIPALHALPNTGPKRVVYDGIDYSARYSHLYLIDAVEVLSVKTMPRLTGPAYDYVGGARITVRFTMTPYYVDPETLEVTE